MNIVPSVRSMRSLWSMRSDEPHQQSKDRGFRRGIQFRYVVAVICMAGMAKVNCLRATFMASVYNLNVLPKEMEPHKNIIMGCYFLGYCFGSIFGGRMTELYSAKWIIFYGNVIVIGFYSLMPLLIFLDNVWVVISARIVAGLADGVTFPAIIVLVARWSPPPERFILCSITFGGPWLGAGMALFVTVLVSQKFGWQSAFYVNGAVYILWLIVHAIYVQDYPSKPGIGLKIEEVEYISSSLSGVLYNQTEVKRSRLPLRKILKSPPFYSILFASFGNRAMYQLVLFQMSEDRKNLQWLKTMGTMSEAVLYSSPFFWSWVCGILIGMVFSTMDHRAAMNKPAAIRILIFVNTIIQVVCMIIDYCAGQNWIQLAKPVIIILCAVNTNVIHADHIEISPNYAGSLVGITTCFANTVFIMGHAYPKYRLPLYAIVAIFSVAAMLNFVLFFSYDVQPWNWNLDEVEREEEEEEVEIEITKKLKENTSALVEKDSLSSWISFGRNTP